MATRDPILLLDPAKLPALVGGDGVSIGTAAADGGPVCVCAGFAQVALSSMRWPREPELMSRLLTDEQVRSVATNGAESVADWVADALGHQLADKQFERLVEAIEHDLTECLEGLMEPDEGEGSGT